MSSEWNHNIHYHDVALSAVPSPCPTCLDVGCGTGSLTRRLARLCAHTTGIDVDPGVLPVSDSPAVTYLAGDIMTYPFATESFTFVTAVATLHHLPLEPALIRFRTLLQPGGTLVIIGLYRSSTALDHLFMLAGATVSRIIRRGRTVTAVNATLRDPLQTLSKVRTAVAACLPGAILKRRLLFRYTVIWRKPLQPIEPSGRIR